MDSIRSTNNVFINCPFDREYKPLFYAVVFSIYGCGFVARCALENQDSSQVRLNKIYDIISECRYGIHDISRTQLNESNLPRFNMPLELGIFLGAKRFGIGDNNKKNCIIVDSQPYRYQEFISDIAGLDIESHNDSYEKIIIIIRDWLNACSHRSSLPAANELLTRYNKFLRHIPMIAQDFNLDYLDLNFTDYIHFVLEWMKYENDHGGY